MARELDPPVFDHAGIAAILDGMAGATGVRDAGETVADRYRIEARRRRGPGDSGFGLSDVRLVERDGVLRWESDRFAGPSGGRRRGRRDARVAAGGDIATQRLFEDLPPNKINAALQKLDDKLSRPRGLRKLVGGKGKKPFDLEPAPAGPFKGKTLLLVHGTFSNNDNYVKEFGATEDGTAFLAWAHKTYTQVLVFDHPTLAVSPVMNALDLSRALAGSSHAVHAIGHSRGGLVLRWWLEGFGAGMGDNPRAVLVGSPIAGTSLASGDRIGNAINLLTNVGAALQKAGGFAEMAGAFLSVPAMLLRIVGSTATDAAVAMVPGLFGQAGVGNNGEIVRLRSAARPPTARYFTVRSNFEPEAPGWKFWKAFRLSNLADKGADAVFDGPNDLVVDMDSMADFGVAGLTVAKSLEFGDNPDVHHLNYFRQKDSLKFLRESLG